MYTSKPVAIARVKVNVIFYIISNVQMFGNTHTVDICPTVQFKWKYNG